MSLELLKNMVIGLPILIRHSENTNDLYAMRIDESYMFYDTVEGDVIPGIVYYTDWKAFVDEYASNCLTVLDWFEPEAPSVVPSMCTCDLFTVLMRTGCQCGGK